MQPKCPISRAFSHESCPADSRFLSLCQSFGPQIVNEPYLKLLSGHSKPMLVFTASLFSKYSVTAAGTAGKVLAVKVHSELIYISSCEISQAEIANLDCTNCTTTCHSSFDSIQMMQEPFGFLTVKVRRLARLQLGTLLIFYRQHCIDSMCSVFMKVEIV